MQFSKALQHTIGWKSLNTLLAFGINLLLVRIMGAESSGTFFYSITVLSFLTLAASWSMEAGITYYGSNDPESTPVIALLIIPVLIVQAAASWLVLRVLPINLEVGLSWVYVLSNLAITYFSALFYARKFFIPVNVIVCLVNLFVFAALGFIHYQGGSILAGGAGAKQSVLDLAANVYFFGFLVQAILLAVIFFLRSTLQPGTKIFQGQLAKNIFRYSSIAFLSNILFFLVTRIDYYFVNRFCDAVSLSNYVQVSKLGQLLVLLPTMMAAVIFPYSAGAGEEDYLQKLQALCRGITLLFLPVSLVIIATGPWLFPWMFGAGFHGMYGSFLWYLPGFYCLSIVTLLAAYLAGKSLLTANLVGTLLALIAVMTGDLLLIPTWGINGAAAASSIAYAVCLCYLLWTFNKKLQVAPAAFFGIRKELQRLTWYKKSDRK
jgi:O-antigen/teichoic acid export membrane protein